MGRAVGKNGAKRIKTQMCELFGMGGCTKGVMCQYAHHESELSTPEEVAAHMAEQEAYSKAWKRKANSDWSGGGGWKNNDDWGSSSGNKDWGDWKSKNNDWGDWKKDDTSSGDWTCPKCGDHVFGRNSTCRMCGTPRPDGGAAHGGGGWKGNSNALAGNAKLAEMAAGAAAAAASGQELIVTDPEAAWRQLEEAYLRQGVTSEQWQSFSKQVEEGCALQGIVRGQWAAAFLASLASGEAQ